MSQNELTAAIPPPSKKKYVIFGMPRFGSSLLLSFRDFVTFFLYTEVFALSGVFTGLATWVGYLAIAISQFTMGALSDRTKTRWGRRRPYIIFGAPVLMLSFFMLFTPPLFLGSAPGEISLFFWLLIWKCIFEFFYGLTTTPYQAMLPEITQVYERPRASQWQNVFAMLGTGAGTAITLLGLTSLTREIEQTRQLNVPFIMIFLGSAIAMVGLFAIFLIASPREQPNFAARESLRANLKQAWQNRNFLKVTIFQGIAGTALAMVQSLMLGFMEKVLHFSGIVYYLAAVILVVVLLGLLTIWKKQIQKNGKKPTLEKILLFSICFLPLSLMGIYQGSEGGLIVPGIIMLIVVASALSGWYLFPYILYADIAEDDARKSNNFKAGLYGGFPSIPLNIFQGLSILFTGFMRDYLPRLEGTTVSGFYVLWGPICALFLAIAFYFLRHHVELDFKWEKDAKPPA